MTDPQSREPPRASGAWRFGSWLEEGRNVRGKKTGTSTMIFVNSLTDVPLALLPHVLMFGSVLSSSSWWQRFVIQAFPPSQ